MEHAKSIDDGMADEILCAESSSSSTDAEIGETLVLRASEPPVDQFDFDDRHDTRATQSDEMARRYAGLRRDRRRDEWHQVAMGLVRFGVVVVVFLTGFVAVSLLLPAFSAAQVMQIVGLACAGTGGGMAARSVGRGLKQRYDRRSCGRSSSAGPGSD
jgi:hypothetical protein